MINISSTDTATRDSFIGREYSLHFLKTKIQGEDYPCISLHGLPRVGKSSLVKEVIRRLEEENSEISVIYYEMPNDDTYYDFWKHLEKKILKLISKNGIDISMFKNRIKSIDKDDDDEIHDLVLDEIELLRDNNIKLLLVLDEFDSAKVVFDKRSSRFKFLEQLRGKSNKLSIVLVSRLNVKELGFESSSNRINYKLELFDQHEIEEFYSRLELNNIFLDDEEKKKFDYYCGKSPALLCLIAQEIFGQLHYYGSIDIDKAFVDKELYIYQLYDDVIKNLKTEELYIPFVQTFIGPKYSLSVDSVKQMRARGYLEIIEENKQIKKCYTICDNFVDYVHQKDVPEQHATWELLGEAERLLRKIIRNGYDEKYSENIGFAKLLKDVYSNNLISLSKYAIGTDENHKRYRSFVANNVNDYDDADILKAAAINELAKILSNHWTREIIFKKYFKNEEYSVWDPKFAVMNKARIPFAHNNFEFLEDSDIDKVNLYSKEIIELEQNNKLKDPKPIKGDFYFFDNGKLIIRNDLNNNNLQNAQSKTDINIAKPQIGNTYTMQNITCTQNKIEGTINGEKCIFYVEKTNKSPEEYIGKEIVVKVNNYNSKYNSFLVVPV